ncbi:hypothetical protein QP178_05555 [Sphingomonas aurantiaca]|uniref:hypothetical protein n=1 Tax=Sphingomonas aurantiaca TaxID=185949 RepID=UPI002FE09E07
MDRGDGTDMPSIRTSKTNATISWWMLLKEPDAHDASESQEKARVVSMGVWCRTAIDGPVSERFETIGGQGRDWL